MAETTQARSPTENARPHPRLHVAELVAMVASLVALNALAIDIMLPALGAISDAFTIANDNDRQLVVVVYLLATGVSQLAYGPLTDRFGRRPVLLGALAGYMIGAALCVIASSFSLLLLARAFQGLTTSAARVVAVAVVRDLSSGRRMAEIMSLATTVFMIVPILAPGLGELILTFADWRGIFVALLVYGGGLFAWMHLRLPETLAPENRTPISATGVARSFLTVARTPVTLGYTLASALVFGGLFGFISASEQILVGVYDLGKMFAAAFAAVAASMTAATILNARLVGRHGMRRISHAALLAFIAVNVIHAMLASVFGLDGFWLFLALMCAAFFCVGLMGANFNALAMEPLGAVAGTASGAFGFATTTIAAAAGGLVGARFDGTATPVILGFALLGAGALASVLVTEKGRLFQVHAPHPETDKI